jgi:hypothetical protein
VPADVESAWLHHRFTQIHPFQDGNGRVARGLATLVFLRDDYLPLVIRDAEHRSDYLDALEAADRGYLQQLVSLFARIQEQDTEEAIGIVRSVRGESLVEQARSAAERARLRHEQMDAETDELTDRLAIVVQTRLDEVCRELQEQFHDQGVEISAVVHQDSDFDRGWWARQVQEIAGQHGYMANLSGHRRWLLLRLWLPGLENTGASIVVSLHQRGLIRGLRVAEAFMSSWNAAGDPGFVGDSTVRPLTELPFVYSTAHREPEAGFRAWLEGVIDTALDQWQSRI